MKEKHFTTRLVVDESADDVFKAIVDVRAWWSGYYNEKFEGDSEKLGDEFSFHAGDGAHYSKQKLVEVIPGRKMVWLITDGALSFIKHKGEWIGTKVIFDISKKGKKTELVFTHEGLVASGECYDACAPAWEQYVQNKLKRLITQYGKLNESI